MGRQEDLVDDGRRRTVKNIRNCLCVWFASEFHGNEDRTHFLQIVFVSPLSQVVPKIAHVSSPTEFRPTFQISSSIHVCLFFLFFSLIGFMIRHFFF